MKPRRALLVLTVFLGMTGLRCLCADPEPPAPAEAAPPPARSTDARLDIIREDLAALRFEKALSALETFLADSSATESQRADALILRAEAHVASGALDRAEEDYREILALEPWFEPDRSLTPKKAVVRFDKVRASTVGVVRLDLDPPDAKLFVDGRPTPRAPDGSLPMLAGSRVLRAERKGFDPAELRLEIAAGKESPAEVHLVPNARTVVLQTETDGVTIRVDGAVVGVTAPAGTETGSAAASGPAQLSIDSLPLGEHLFELSKPCFGTLRLREMIAVDLMNRSPKILGPVHLDPARSRLVVRGGPKDAEIRVDGNAEGKLPIDALELCAGRREVEVRAGGRAVFWSRVDLPEQGEAEIEVQPRPNATLVGASDWPEPLRDLGDSVSTRQSLEPPDGVDLGTAEGWRGIPLAPDTDLALAVVASARSGSSRKWLLYSPILRTVDSMEGGAEFRRPSWRRSVIGARVADSALLGKAIVVDVDAGGPAAAAGIGVGDRLTAVGGVPVRDAADARRVIASVVPGTPVELVVTGISGEKRELRCVAASSPVLLDASERPGPQAWYAAWADVDAASGADAANSALANLAQLLSEAGHHDLAAQTWRRVLWPNRPGVGAGTAAYFLGRELESLGREDVARVAFTEARDSSSTAPDDEGLAVSPAAADHLADLGVAGNP